VLNRAAAFVTSWRHGITEGVRGFDPAAMARLRKARGLTLDALGERVGRARPNVIKWEAGEAPSPPKLVALARALDVDPWQMTLRKPQAAELADLRDWAGLTRRALAARAGIRRSTYAEVLDCDVSTVERAYRRGRRAAAGSS
jgi:transcriptional regulator with XRE-family HTH domain